MFGWRYVQYLHSRACRSCCWSVWACESSPPSASTAPHCSANLDVCTFFWASRDPLSRPPSIYYSHPTKNALILTSKQIYVFWEFSSGPRFPLVRLKKTCKICAYSLITTEIDIKKIVLINNSWLQSRNYKESITGKCLHLWHKNVWCVFLTSNLHRLTKAFCDPHTSRNEIISWRAIII